MRAGWVQGRRAVRRSCAMTPRRARPATPVPAAADLHERVLAWYGDHARDLPWRSPGCSPWGVLVSEVMLQQTPVARVLPRWQAWLERWPEPADLAAEPPGEAVRMWDRLGYPRRALRLHAAAVAIRDEHGGRVPDDHAQLLALPGDRAPTPPPRWRPSPSASATPWSTPTSGACRPAPSPVTRNRRRP